MSHLAVATDPHRAQSQSRWSRELIRTAPESRSAKQNCHLLAQIGRAIRPRETKLGTFTGCYTDGLRLNPILNVMRSTYHFGSLIKEVNIFAHPRTGSHFFHYCLTGLFDVVTMPHAFLHHGEALSREKELNPEALYALDLRQPTVPLQPLHVNALVGGVHGLPVESDCSTIILIRDPISTVYSRYRVDRDRWGGIKELTAEWLKDQLLRYAFFYDRGMDVLDRLGKRGILVRWSDLVAGPEALERVVDFVGLTPKLQCSFVWSIMRFGSFVGPEPRTFYRSGSNTAWHKDSHWINTLAAMEDLSFERFGYLSISEYLSDAEEASTIPARQAIAK